MARILTWVLDAIIIVMIVRAVLGFIRNRQAAGRGAGPSPSRHKTQERLGGTLVRDPNCDTYIPEAGAIRVKVGDETLYFCSAACRDAYQART